MMSDNDPAGAASGAADDEPLVAPAASGDAIGGVYDEAVEAPVDEPPVAAAPAPAAVPEGTVSGRARMDSHNMLPPRERRRSPVERMLVRLIATAGIVAIGVAIAAIMVSSNSQGWIVGLVVSIVSVVLAAILWSSRQL
jgi:hypothetical protein